jgi:hypothetical protein
VVTRTKASQKNVRPDSKGRVALGKLAEGVSSFDVLPNSDGSLVLRPKVEIPAADVWLFKNPAALASVKRGLTQSANGQYVKRPRYAKHAEDPDE